MRAPGLEFYHLTDYNLTWEDWGKQACLELWLLCAFLALRRPAKRLFLTLASSWLSQQWCKIILWGTKSRQAVFPIQVIFRLPFHERWDIKTDNYCCILDFSACLFSTSTVSLQTHILRKPTFFFSSLFSAITVDIPRSCLVRNDIA